MDRNLAAVIWFSDCPVHSQKDGSRGLNSSPPSTTYMRQWTGSALVQVMACRLFGAKPLPEPMLIYCQLDA